MSDDSTRKVSRVFSSIKTYSVLYAQKVVTSMYPSFPKYDFVGRVKLTSSMLKYMQILCFNRFFMAFMLFGCPLYMAMANREILPTLHGVKL